MKRLLALFLLSVLLLTSCNTPAAPIDSETTETIETTAAPTDAESTTPEDKETTTPEDVESTTPQESESDTTAQIPPKDLLTEFPEIPRSTPYCWTKRIVEKFVNVSLKDLTPIVRNEKGQSFQMPFKEIYNNHAPILYYTQKWGVPIENITLTDYTHACVVYKIVHEDNGQEVFLYQMYEHEIYDLETEQYVRSKEAYWGTSLQYSDFADLQPGSSFEKAQAIAPQIGWCLLGSTPEKDNYLLLKDGVLYIELSLIDDSDYFVSEMHFFPNGSDAEINGQKLSILKAENRPPLPGEDD